MDEVELLRSMRQHLNARAQQLDEDAQAAQAAAPGPWKPNPEHDEVVAADDSTVADGFALSGRQLRATVDHIVRWDPDRVLKEVRRQRAEVEAVRSILDELQEVFRKFEADDRWGGWPEHGRQSLALTVLEMIAAGIPDLEVDGL